MGTVKAQEIAKRMQISISTVYKAFNGAEDINDETRAAILETAAEMGYTRKKRTPNTRRVCVFMGRMEAPHVTYYLYEVMIAFKQSAEQYGYEIIIRSLDDGGKCSYNQIMENSRFEGALVLGLNDKDVFLRQLSDTEILYPAVLVDNYIDNPKISCVASDNLSGMNLVVSHLMELGHREIGFINGEESSFSSRERFAGYLNAITLNGLQFDATKVRNGDYSEYSGGVLAKELYKSGVTAIVCASDLMAIGAIRELMSIGIRVPQDVSVTGFDDIKLSSYITPTLTTARINIKDVGYRAFLCLRDLLEGKHAARVVQSPRLMIRESTAPIST